MTDHVRRIAELGTASGGVITAAQLRTCGITTSQTSKLVARGHLFRVSRGTYRVGHAAPSRDSTFLCAVRASGDGALLSHWAAAELHGIVRTAARSVDVTVPSRRRPILGVVLHTWTTSEPVPRTAIRGIPVVDLWHCVADLASIASVPIVVRAIREATFQRSVTTETLIRLAHARDGRVGAPVLRSAVAEFLTGSHGVGSLDELAAIESLTSAGFPPPLVNVAVEVLDGTVRPDLCYPDISLCVEIDGRQHGRLENRRKDAERRRRLVASGYDVIVVLTSDLRNDARRALESVIRTIQQRTAHRTQHGALE